MSVASLAGSRERAHSRVAASSACRPSLLRGCVCTLQTGSIIATACTGTHPHHPYEAALIRAALARDIFASTEPDIGAASLPLALIHLSSAASILPFVLLYWTGPCSWNFPLAPTLPLSPLFPGL
jgi:hypothetical protein